MIVMLLLIGRFSSLIAAWPVVGLYSVAINLVSLLQVKLAGGRNMVWVCMFKYEHHTSLKQSGHYSVYWSFAQTNYRGISWFK
jgi:hypothetical protein